MSKYVSLALSGSNSTGKTTLCEVLSNKLGWNHVTVGQEFRRLANEYNLKIEDFGSIPDKILRQVDVIMRERMTNEQKTIWDGRLSCFLARDHKEIYKVLCTASLEVRAHRSSERENISLTEAKQLILNREIEERQVFNRLYGLDNPFDEIWIDLIVDTSRNTPEELAYIVLDSIGINDQR